MDSRVVLVVLKLNSTNHRWYFLININEKLKMEFIYTLQNVAVDLKKYGWIFMPFYLIFLTLTTYNNTIIIRILINNWWNILCSK